MRLKSLELLVVLLFFPSSAVAQEESSFVSVPVSVSDRDGRYVAGLKKEDFTIFQEGKPQKITFFAREDEPISVALLIDTSESTANVLDKIRDAAKDFIDLLNKGDRCFIATFDSEFKIISPFSDDRGDLKKSLNKITTDDAEGSVVFGAVETVTRTQFTGTTGRKVIVLLSDGKDLGSSVTRKELFAGLEESDVLIYSIFYQTGRVAVDETGAVKKEEPKKAAKEKKKEKKKGYSIKINLPRTDTYTPDDIKLADRTTIVEAVNVLQEMADTTAGRFYMSDAPNLGRIFRQIATELRQQYRVGFKSSANDEILSEIIVKVGRPDTVVRARGKYRAKKL